MTPEAKKFLAEWMGRGVFCTIGPVDITAKEANKMGAILVMGRKKKDIWDQMLRCGFAEELLKKVSLYQCTQEEVENAKGEIVRLQDNYKIYEEIKPEKLWLDDLNVFIKAYCRYYKCKYEGMKKVIRLNLV